ncbi:sodium-coupled monocarboxylate transporter 1-like [Procambarus clarkii]|uniref:sodium-coupled monocarboxylate transporter 1-like n=1 Tax=Procambarus clarkii TaxID=6728 RepID=UPI0037427DAA
MSGYEKSVTASRGESETKFSTVDYAVFSLMLVVSIGIGLYSAIKSRHKTSTQEYLLGGRKMSPLPVALSLLGGGISAISLLGNATELYLFGTQLCTCLLGIIPGCVFVHQVILPIFYNLKIVSLSQYIEKRYKSRALRMLVTGCQLLMMFFYLGICLYTPSLALSTVTNLSTTVSMGIMGSVCTFYITIGGVKAVVYTDVMQTLLMFGGVLLVVTITCVDLGGVGNVWALADQGSRIEFFNLDTSPFVRHTFWSTTVLGFYLMVSKVGIYQPAYQRFASLRTLNQAQGVCIAFVVGLCAIWSTFYFSGLVAYATYKDCDPLTLGRIEKPDQILPYLVMDKLDHLTGVPGIFVAAVYGGVLRSVNTQGNSNSGI